MSDTRYRLHREGEYIIDCDRCGSSDTPTIKATWAPFPMKPSETEERKRPHEYLCQFCYETHFGNLFRYPQYRDTVPLARALCQALNLLARK